MVHPCKTVGVVLRWFESITRHHSRTAPDQAIYRSGPLLRRVSAPRFVNPGAIEAAHAESCGQPVATRVHRWSHGEERDPGHRHRHRDPSPPRRRVGRHDGRPAQRHSSACTAGQGDEEEGDGERAVACRVADEEGHHGDPDGGGDHVQGGRDGPGAGRRDRAVRGGSAGAPARPVTRTPLRPAVRGRACSRARSAWRSQTARRTARSPPPGCASRGCGRWPVRAGRSLTRTPATSG